MAQSLARVYLHIIFSTKNRAGFLGDENIRKEMHAYLAATLKELDSPAVLVGGATDHVHILCTLSKTHTLADVIREIKRNSSKWIKTKSGEYSTFHWQTGYGAFSVSYSSVSRAQVHYRPGATSSRDDVSG